MHYNDLIDGLYEDIQQEPGTGPTSGEIVQSSKAIDISWKNKGLFWCEARYVRLVRTRPIVPVMN